jgi:PAS domain S-box-containing protein
VSNLKRALWGIALVLVALVLIANALLSNYNARELLAGGAASARSRDTIYAIDDLLSDLTEAETGQRGYLLTQKAAYLEPYRAAAESMGTKVAALKPLLADEPEQLERLAVLEKLVADKAGELHRTISLIDAGDAAAAMALVATDSGMLTMRAIRQLVGDMRETEKKRQALRDARETELYSWTVYSFFLGMILGLALIGVAAALLRRDLLARNRAARELHVQREWLSTTLRSIGDGVIVTDPQTRILMLNPVAETLTGWPQQEALGRPLLEVFDAIDETTRRPAEDPVGRAIAEGRISGFANHTLLRARDGREFAIEDSAAPIVEPGGAIQGAVIVFRDFTERRNAELALAGAAEEISRRAVAALASEQTLKTILENAPIGISMTGPGPDYPMIAMSSQMREWLGAGENRPSRELYRKLMPDGTVPAPSMLPLFRAMNEGKIVRDEAWVVARPGRRPLTVIVNVAPVRNIEDEIIGAVHSWVDTTEQQRLDRALQVTQSRLRVLVDAGVIGLMLSFDRDGNVAQANGALLNMLDFTDEDLAEGRINLVAQTPAEYRQADAAAFAQVATAGACPPYEKEFIRRSGERVSVVVGYARVFASADEYVGFALDVTERKLLEQQLRQQADQLLLADRRKDEFLAMLAHELRNPLAPLRNALYLLEADKQRQWSTVDSVLPTMRRQINQLVRMVDDLLDAARISQNKILVEKAVVDLKPILRAAVETVQPLISARGHRLDLDIDPRPMYVCGDSARLIQAFSNILHNAAKYTPDHGYIGVAAAPEQSEARISVHDSGQGISPELLPRVFEPFIQADQSLARSAGGLGVGLALVRRVTELHGGDVHAISAGLGKGSEFVVRLPLVEVPADVDTARPAAPAAANSSASLRILVADDNRDLVASTSALLDLWGHQSHTVHSGNEVLPAALAFRPDVILLDIGLPEIDGFELARQIRAESALGGTRLVAMTGYGQDSDRARGRDAGFDTHLVKPVHADLLKATIEQR